MHICGSRIVVASSRTCSNYFSVFLFWFTASILVKVKTMRTRSQALQRWCKYKAIF